MLFELIVGAAVVALLLTLPVGWSMIAILVKVCLSVVVAGIALLAIVLTSWAVYLYWPVSAYTLGGLGGLLVISYVISKLFPPRPRRLQDVDVPPPAPRPPDRVEPFL
jgi:hypothetical protein